MLREYAFTLTWVSLTLFIINTSWLQDSYLRTSLFLVQAVTWIYMGYRFDLIELDFGIRAILFILVGIVGMLLSRLFYKK